MVIEIEKKKQNFEKATFLEDSIGQIGFRYTLFLTHRPQYLFIVSMVCLF